MSATFFGHLIFLDIMFLTTYDKSKYHENDNAIFAAKTGSEAHPKATGINQIWPQPSTTLLVQPSLRTPGAILFYPYTFTV